MDISTKPERSPTQRSSGTQWPQMSIAAGCGLFVAALAGSALAVPRLLWLHVFQALIYVAVYLLARRHRALGYGAGATIAVAWNALEWLGPHLIQAGAHEFTVFLTTGHVRRPDTLMVFIAAIAHVVLLVGCAIAFRQLRPAKKEWGLFVLGGIMVLAYFAVIVVTLAPK